MRFEIIVNQKAIIEHGLDLDLVDGAILDYCLRFARSGDCQTSAFDGEVYYWLEHNNICQQLPILKMKPDTAYRRMKALCEKKFLKAYPSNKQLGRSWYALLPLTDLLPTIGRKSDGTGTPSDENPMGIPEAAQTIGFSSDAPLKPSDENPMVGQNGAEIPENQPVPSDENPMPIGKLSDPPSDENPMYNLIREEDNNNNSLNAASDARTDGLLEAEKKGEAAPPPTPAPPKPIPIPPGKTFGDGKLQAEVVAFHADNPDAYPLAYYLPFLRYWSQVLQKGKPDLIGSERWRTMDSWDTEDRLSRWHERELKGKQSHGNPNTSTPNGRPVGPQNPRISQLQRNSLLGF